MINFTKPTLIKNEISKWGISHWNEEYIKKIDGDTVTTVTTYGRPITPQYKCTFSDFFDYYKNQGYYTFNRLRLDLDNRNKGPNFIKDIIIPNEFKKFNFEQHVFVSGNTGTGALPHTHEAAVNLLVYGKKKWILFDASENNKDGRDLMKEYMDSYPYEKATSSKEWFNNEYDTSLQKYKDRNNEVIEFIQESGDVIFIPKHWSHTIINLDECLGITLLERHIKISDFDTKYKEIIGEG
jgi:hypothetical protein